MNTVIKYCLICLAAVVAALPAAGQTTGRAGGDSCGTGIAGDYAGLSGGSVVYGETDRGVAIAVPGRVLPLVTDRHADPGVTRAVHTLADDFARVTGTRPEVVHYHGRPEGRAIYIGTYGDSPLIGRLAGEGLIDAAALEGKREKFVIKTVTDPFPGVDEGVIIAGSDKRGTIYGIFELSRAAGVSPWHFWADVPVRQSEWLTLLHGEYTAGEPAVEYRGIFLNDEAPALTGWVNENFGGYNSRFYLHVFELLQRLRANFLWPAMWDAAFYDDDPLNSVLADQMGIVMGTSHHEPMARAHKEWGRYGTGPWDFRTNRPALEAFWRAGIERMKHTGDIVTLAMRGDGDEPMSEESNVVLLEEIVAAQRRIIGEVTHLPPERTPQVWALYKEVQDYYDNGMCVPDDVTLLLCDDNWGNVRKLPDPAAPPRGGGYGMYYHFDYVGGPRNYKWINVRQVQRIWEQMNLTYRHGVSKIWVVNVGDLKPMEYPIQFFLDMAWNPDRFDHTGLFDHTVEFCREQFGGHYAREAARIIDTYSKYNARVTPELLDPDTYSLHNYNEFATVTADYRALATDALRLYHLMPAEYRDAFDQLVLYPAQASANLYEMYFAVAMNRELYAKGDPGANLWAARAAECFARDSVLTYHYNNVMSGGKWNHMMDQVRIGYTGWQQPPRNIMPEVMTVETPGGRPAKVFGGEAGYISMEAGSYSRMSEDTPYGGDPGTGENGIGHDLSGNPAGGSDITSSGTRNDRSGAHAHGSEGHGHAAGNPYHAGTGWIEIANLGKTVSGLTTVPVTVPPGECTYIEYDIETPTGGRAEVIVLCSPTLNFNGNRGLRYAVSFDGGPEQVVNINGEYDIRQMEQWQARSVNSTSTYHSLDAGRHTLRFRPLDAGLVLQKIIVDLGGLQPSYLGPPETPAMAIE
ncbi:MAG: glycosyl hydrolase 115 family protein [Rikenellaceae bacterium]|nr:glycosyl hydrolase 115 family protein [Rikenellaceae bacterium]